MAEGRQSWNSGGSWRSSESRQNNSDNRWHTTTYRPPLHPGIVQDAVPLWEKKYCTTMLRIPWKMMCLNQNYTGLCRNVMEWDDSGALEAFKNAKSRFCDEYHGAPCSIPLPDPDLYIDKVNYYAFVDPELVDDLDKEPPPPVDGIEFGGVNSVIVRESCNVVSSGWDDAEENVAGNNHDRNWDAYVRKPIQKSGWDAGGPNSGWNANEGNDGWGLREPADTWNFAATGWGVDVALPVDPWTNGRDNQNEFGRDPQPWKTNNWEASRGYSRKRDGGGRSNGRYTKPKYNLGVYQPNNNWRNCMDRNSSDSHYERKVYPKQPTAW